MEPKQLDQLLHPTFKAETLKSAKVIAKGLAASPGAAAGKIYFTAEEVSEAFSGRTVSKFPSYTVPVLPSRDIKSPSFNTRPSLGKIYFTAEEVSEASKNGPVILVRLETSPEDIQGMNDAQGILTIRGCY